MQTVSAQFQSAVYASSRRARGKILCEILNEEAYNSVSTITCTSLATISQLSQTVNRTYVQGSKWAMLLPNYWKADGTFGLPPDDTQKSAYETAFWTEELSQADKTFTNVQTCTITVDSDISTTGITINFDLLNNAYAEEFVIEALDSVSSIVTSSTITSNTHAVYVLSGDIPDFRTINIGVQKWSGASRRASITEVSLGLSETLTGSDLFDMDIIEEVDTIAKEITSNELKLNLTDINKLINILNPTGAYQYFAKRNKLKAYYGIDVNPATTEWVNMGEFYVLDWSSAYNNIEQTLYARDILDILRQSIYRKHIVEEENLYNIAENILQDAGVTQYDIDAELATVTCSGNIPICSHREALQTVAVAGMAVLYADREGRVVLDVLETASTTTQTINFSNSFEKPKIVKTKLINTIETNVFNYNEKTVSEEIYSGLVNINGTEDVVIEYKEYPCNYVTASITTGSINSATYYSNSALLNITSTGLTEVTIEGNVFDVSRTNYRLVSANKTNLDDNYVSTIDCPLITGYDQAVNVSDYVLGEYEKRNIYNCDWRGNPALELDDILEVKDAYGVNNTARIIKNQFYYNGGFSCFSELKGG